MPAIVSDSFIQAAQRLDPASTKAIWGFLAKFNENPAHPGASLERVQQAKSKDVWSARIGRDLRAIIHQDGDAWMLLYAGRHDDAYDWASSRRIERHILTGAFQIVETPQIVSAPGPSPSGSAGLFSSHKDDYLLSLGVPPSWLPTLRAISDEDTLLNDVLPKLPADVADRLLALAAGEVAVPPPPVASDLSASQTATSLGSFHLLESNDDLHRLLAAPMSTWIAFLHPSQKRLVEGAFNGPVKITGSAGTGKTVVAMHRARRLARQGRRVLLTSFVTTLCRNLEHNLGLFCTAEELDRITVSTLHHQAMTLAQAAGDSLNPIDNGEIGKRLAEFSVGVECPLGTTALLAELEGVFQAQGITSWDAYRRASRVGRGRPLSVKDRRKVWDVIEKVQMSLERQGEIDWAGLCRRAAEHIESGRIPSPYQAVVVDEVQDLGPQELRLLSRLAGTGADCLTLVGDGGQRIYGGRFSLSALGIDVRGRSHVLRLNYRTSDQIRRFADRVLGGGSDDLDGGRESRRGARSLFAGPEPVLSAFDDRDRQSEYIVARIESLLEKGRTPDEIAIFARQANLLDRTEKRLTAAGIHWHRLSKDGDASAAAVRTGTMHRAKGLEFKVVFVVDVSDDKIPSKQALKSASDDALIEAVLEQERQLLYVSVTRARDEVYISWTGEQCRFLPVGRRENTEHTE